MEPVSNIDSFIISSAPFPEAAVWVWCAAHQMSEQLVEPNQRLAAQGRLPAVEAALLAKLLYDLASRLSEVDGGSVSRRALSLALLLWDQWEHGHHDVSEQGQPFVAGGPGCTPEIGRTAQRPALAGTTRQRSSQGHRYNTLLPHFTEGH